MGHGGSICEKGGGDENVVAGGSIGESQRGCENMDTGGQYTKVKVKVKKVQVKVKGGSNIYGGEVVKPKKSKSETEGTVISRLRGMAVWRGGFRGQVDV